MSFWGWSTRAAAPPSSSSSSRLSSGLSSSSSSSSSATTTASPSSSTLSSTSQAFTGDDDGCDSGASAEPAAAEAAVTTRSDDTATSTSDSKDTREGADGDDDDGDGAEITSGAPPFLGFARRTKSAGVGGGGGRQLGTGTARVTHASDTAAARGAVMSALSASLAASSGSKREYDDDAPLAAAFALGASGGGGGGGTRKLSVTDASKPRYVSFSELGVEECMLYSWAIYIGGRVNLIGSFKFPHEDQRLRTRQKLSKTNFDLIFSQFLHPQIYAAFETIWARYGKELFPGFKDRYEAIIKTAAGLVSKDTDAGQKLVTLVELQVKAQTADSKFRHHPYQRWRQQSSAKQKAQLELSLYIGYLKCEIERANRDADAEDDF